MTSRTWKSSDVPARVEPGAAAGSRRRGGFTLLELLLAIGLLGLILGMAFPRFTGARLQFFAQESEQGLVNSVRAARIAAIRDRAPVALTVAHDDAGVLQERRLPARSWSEIGIDGQARRDESWEGVWDAPVMRAFRAGGAIEMDATDKGVVFFPNGRSTGGRIAVKNEGGELVSLLLIDPHTSEVLVQ